MIEALIRAALGIFLLTGMDAVVKAQMIEHPFGVAVFLRFVAGSIVAAVAIAIARPAFPTRDSLRANALRVPVVVLTASTFFYSVDALPLAEALALAFLAPVFVAIFGVLLLKERLNPAILAALAAGLAGMLVMTWPRLTGEVTGALDGVAAALVSAIAYAFNLVLLRRIALKEHPSIIVFAQNAGPALVLALPAMFWWSSPDLADYAAFMGAGILGVAGHLLLTSAFARAPASRLAPVEYTALVWASILGFTFFGERPSLETYAGALLIIAGALILTRR
jgi:drug/metabolite transporter (DMT)-like permease